MREIVMVDGIPLDETVWEKTGDEFVVLKDGQELTVTKFGADPSGSIWNIGLKEDDASFRFVVFSLEDDPSEWQLEPLTQDNSLPSEETLATIYEVIQRVRSTEEFLDLD